MCSSLEELVTSAEVVVIANHTPAFCRVLGLLCADQVLIDLVGLTPGYGPSRGGFGEDLRTAGEPATMQV
jgi:hypothetical protein